MRENRLSGSEGGGAEFNRPSLPLSRSGLFGGGYGLSDVIIFEAVGFNQDLSAEF